MLQTWLPLFGGLILLITGGELLVRGAVKVARRLGVSPLVIGLTLVGFGTSTPELVTSVQAALAGAPGIAYGNIVGSNIANILLILGAAAMITPILVTSAALKRDGAVMAAVAVGFAAIAAVTPLGFFIGAGFVLLLGVYIFVAFRQERAVTAGDHGAAYDKSVATRDVDPALDPAMDPTLDPRAKPAASILVSAGIAVAGLVLVIIGGKFLVDGAVTVARSFGLSETVVGLTIVAVGTSMPEFITSVVAAIRRHSEIAFGNIVGSNIYNILGIGGFTALAAPGNVPAEIIRFDNPVMVGATVLVVGLAFSGRKLSRWEGLLLLVAYACYVAWIWP